MARSLDVYFHRNLAGRLTQTDQGPMEFEYVPQWLKSAEAVPLSQSLPLRSGPFKGNECQPFFGGILPEETQREIIARNVGVSAKNDFALLEQIGGECAGAITFIASGEDLEDQESEYRPLSDAQLAATLRELPVRPLMAGQDGVRLSLAGAQNKMAVRVDDGRFSIPLGGAPSTHILKPANKTFEGLVFNEATCMRLAQAIGLNTAQVSIGRVDDIDYLLVERYDRQQDSTKIIRLHQEDFCQALGILSDYKYQSEGGPSLAQSFELVRQVSSAPVLDLQVLLDAVIFNLVIGNHDAHGKNFSLLYEGNMTRLAPLYDLVSTVYYPEISKKMAMKLGGEYASDSILARHFDHFAEETNLSKQLVKKRVLEVLDTVLAQVPGLMGASQTSDDVLNLIQERTERFAGRFQAGL